MVAPPCRPFELSPLNELYRGKLVRSITLRLFEIFMIFGRRICQVKTRARMVAPPWYPFELSPLNELYRGKLGSILIVIIQRERSCSVVECLT